LPKQPTESGKDLMLAYDHPEMRSEAKAKMKIPSLIESQ